MSEQLCSAEILTGLLSRDSGVVLLASLGTLHWKPRRRHGSDLFRAVFRCSQVIYRHTHTHTYIYIETDSKLKNRHNDRWSKVERTCEALLMWWCCLMLPVSSRKGWRWAAHWNLGLWRRSREQQVATHWCGYLLEARTFHPGRNSWEAASGCLRLPRKHIRHHAPKICLKCSLSGIPLWAGNPSGWTLFHPCTQKRSCGALIAVHRRRA